MKVFSGRLRPSMVAAGRGLFLSVVGLAVSITLFVLAVVSISFILLGIGVFTTPVVLEAVRKHANQRRLRGRSPGRTYGFRSRTGASPRICGRVSPARSSAPR